MKLNDFYEHPHERGELTASEFAMLVSDYERAGCPEDLLGFLGAISWVDLPLDVIRRTLNTQTTRPKEEFL